jgi:hypothetical protein
MRVSDGLTMRRVKAPPSGARQIDLWPGMQITTLALKIAFLITACETRGEPLCPTTVNEQDRQVPACTFTTLKRLNWGLWSACLAMDMPELVEQFVVEAIKKTQSITIDGQAQLCSEGRHRIVCLDTFQVGARADHITRMIDWQRSGRWIQDKIEGIVPQGFNLHRQLNFQMVGFRLEPDLRYPVALKVDVFIASLRYRRDIQLVINDALGAVVARTKAQLMWAE